MSTRKLAGLFALCAAVALGIAFLSPLHSPVSAAKKPAILVNVTSGTEDLHAVSMALGLAGTSLDHGHEVVVFLNVHAPVIASKSLGDDVKIADFPPVREMLSSVIKRGGSVYVCSHCASVCNVAMDTLVEGVKASEHGDVLEALQPGMVGFSY